MLRFSPLRPVTASWLFLAFVFLLGCTKESDPAVWARGNLEVTIAPAGAASAVTATAKGGQPVTAVPDARTGAFVFADLPIGAYQLGAVPTVGFRSPEGVPATVWRGTTNKSTVQIPRDGRIRGTMTWERNGTACSAVALYGDIERNFISLEGATAMDASGQDERATFVLPFGGASPTLSTPFAGVGTYPLGATQYPYAGYFNGSSDWYTTAYAGQPVGQVVVTRFEPEAGVASGTFQYVSFLRFNNSGSAAPKQTITNGRFDITF